MNSTVGKYVSKIAGGCLVATAMLSTSAIAENGDTLKAVQERGSLLCSGHNGSFPPFVQVTDDNKWSGYDIDYCRALAVAVLGSDDKLKVVPISWAQENREAAEILRRHHHRHHHQAENRDRHQDPDRVGKEIRHRVLQHGVIRTQHQEIVILDQDLKEVVKVVRHRILRHRVLRHVVIRIPQHLEIEILDQDLKEVVKVVRHRILRHGVIRIPQHQGPNSTLKYAAESRETSWSEKKLDLKEDLKIFPLVLLCLKWHGALVAHLLVRNHC